MQTHTLTIELSDNAFRSLKEKVSSGAYSNVNEVFEAALLDSTAPVEFDAPISSNEEWLHQEAVAAYDEHLVNPTEVYTSEQVHAYLSEQRTLDAASK